jgi:predicted Zn-dependent peptidase
VSVDRSRLPVPGLPRPFKFPAIHKSTLVNGLRVWSVQHPSVPVVSLMMLMRSGAANDPTGLDGLAAITLDMLDEGSGSRSAIEIHEALARIGTQLESDIGSDAALLSMTVLSRFAEPAISLLGDIAARPSITDADFERVRQLRLHRLVQLRDVPSAVADRAFVRLLYGDHPYGHTPLGSERTLRAISVDDVRRFHHTVMRPGDATLVAVGDCDHETIERLAAQAFSGWQNGAAHVAPEERPAPAASRLNVVPRPGAPQSELRIGHIGVARSTPDYHALVIANTILGGQFVSRINLNLREDKGFTYGARTAFDFRRMPGPFCLTVSVQTSATARAIEESIDEISAIRGRRPVTRTELDLGIAALTRGYARNFETADHIARAITQIALYDLPDNYFEEFVPRVAAVSADDVTRVAEAHLSPERLTTLVVGDLDVVAHELNRLPLGAPEILANELS